MAMDFAREIELIRTIDHDLQQLLARVHQLGSAGDARPLLTAVGRTLELHLSEVGEVIGTLASLLPEVSTEVPQIRRKPTARTRTPRDQAGVALQQVGALATTALPVATPEPATRAVPAAPALRAKRRRSPIDRPARPDGEPAVGGLDAAPEMAPRDESGHPPADPTPDAAQAPVYRLRKAGTKEAPVGPAVRARDELQRLSDFFQISGSALTQ